ncbi:MAG: hypothetical protein WC243_03045 [Patescibacteria group bacterium]|jgi:hypothetical protein
MSTVLLLRVRARCDKCTWVGTKTVGLPYNLQDIRDLSAELRKSHSDTGCEGNVTIEEDPPKDEHKAA